MKQVANLDQRGVGHVGVIVVVVALALVGLSGWWVMKHQDKDPASLASAELQAAIKNAKCDYDDKDLCKFFASWKASKYYTIESKQTTKDQADGSMKIEVEGDYSHITTFGEISFEIISIGDTTYTKDPSDGKWWKQTIKNDDSGKVSSGNYTDNFKLDEPTTEDKTTYKKISTEKCGNLTCLKYQVINPETTDPTEYIWFDTKDYQLRRMQSISADSSYDATFSYSKVSVKAPSPVKELKENEYIIPGQSEPVTLPNADALSEEDMQQLMQQYQAQ